MSNPAVIKLQSGTVGKSKVWLDDNFGESIHIHIEDFRADLSVNEFKQLYEDLCLAINEFVCVDGFDIRKIDPVFFAVMLWPRLSDLVGVSYDQVSLGKMLAPVHSKIVPLPESMGVKAIKGLSAENNRVSRRSHHIGQSDNERMAAIMESIKTNGYPYNENYIVMFGDDTIIRDGQHRASCLYSLYGDIEVPVLRLHFQHYQSTKVDRYYNHRLRVFFRRHVLNAAKKLGRKLRSLKRRIGRKVRTARLNKPKQAAFPAELQQIFDAK